MGMVVAPSGTACTPVQIDPELQHECLVFQADAYSLWTLRIANAPKNIAQQTAIQAAHRMRDWLATKGVAWTENTYLRLADAAYGIGIENWKKAGGFDTYIYGACIKGDMPP